jgi:REP element-mobilizing transposase RayT
MRKRGPHKACGLYAHITWHTWRRDRSIRRADVPEIVAAVVQAGRCRGVRVHAQAVLTDHVHLIVSYNPAVALAPFVRHAKSESARRANLLRNGVEAPLRWCRGYYAGSLSRAHVGAARAYLAKQHLRHPDRIPN